MLSKESRGLIGCAAIVALGMALPASGFDVVVSGVIRDEVTTSPIADAMVTLQATSVRTTTDADGRYELTIPGASGSVIVAAIKGYFNRSATYTGETLILDIDLQPILFQDDPDYNFIPPKDCGLCHPNQLEQWYGSPMAGAGLNTWLHDIYGGNGTPGGMGGFVYVRDSAYAKSNPASECAACHQPERWITTPFAPMDWTKGGSPSEEAVHGISCETCHKIANVDVKKINYPGIFPGAVDFIRPNVPEYDGQVEFGLLGDTDVEFPWLMRPSYQPQLMAEVCGTCHQDKNDPAEDHSFTGVTSEPTYVEWAESPYADPNSAMYANCLDCHMLPTKDTTACDILFPPLEREPGTLRDHNIVGSSMLYHENAVELTVTTQVIGDQLNVEAEIFNAYTGHHVPTGVTVRNMILLVEAWMEESGTSLTFTGDQTIHELGGTGNPDQGYWAGLPGKFFAKVNHDASGNGPTFFTDATGIQFDNRIPALQADYSNYTFELPAGGGEVHVRARLVYRKAFRFLVDAKQWTEDGHGQPLGDVQAPHFGYLMEMTDEVVTFCSGADLNGDLTVDFADLLQLLAAWGPCGGGCPEDIDDDLTVDFDDLLILLSSWGSC